MSKLAEHLANVVTMIEEIGKDAAHVEARFAGDVEGHLRVVEAHLMEIINAVRATPAELAEVPAEPEQSEPEAAAAEVPAEPEPAEETPAARRRR